MPETQDFVYVSSGIKAVSYTHLRAHETVLDLVCRLLLEKKKGKQWQITTLCSVIDDNSSKCTIYT